MTMENSMEIILNENGWFLFICGLGKPFSFLSEGEVIFPKYKLVILCPWKNVFHKSISSPSFKHQKVKK